MAAVDASVDVETSALIVALLHAFDWLELDLAEGLRRRAEASLVEEHKQLI
jgi:hypothetical protein